MKLTGRQREERATARWNKAYPPGQAYSHIDTVSYCRHLMRLADIPDDKPLEAQMRILVAKYLDLKEPEEPEPIPGFDSSPSFTCLTPGCGIKLYMPGRCPVCKP